MLSGTGFHMEWRVPVLGCAADDRRAWNWRAHMKTPGWKFRCIGAVTLLGLAMCASAGVGIRWLTQWGAYDHTATDLTGGEGALLDSSGITWQLIYAGADDAIDPPNLTNSAQGCVSGDDAVWAVRSIPQGGGAADDGTTWDNWMTNLSGDPIHEDLDWSTAGYVYMRVYEGTPASGVWYYDAPLLALDTGYAGGATPLQDYFADSGEHGFQPNQQVFGDMTPQLAIRTANTSVGFATSNLTVAGTAFGLTGQLAWSNSLGGGGTLAMAASWSFVCPLAKGTNVITVQGTNQTGAVSDTLTVIRTGSAPPVPTIVSAAMREGTTLMDVVYRVDDADDDVVSAYPLAFVDGVRSFANAIRPATFEEGTEANVGAAIAANVEHALVWNVAADWNVDLGQIKFEIICKDSRGLLSFDWLTIPATAGSEEITISQNAPSSSEVLNALFYLYASGDPGLDLAGGVLSGSAASEMFDSMELVDGTVLQATATPYVLQQMDLAPANSAEVRLAMDARSGLANATAWHAANRPFAGYSLVFGWGSNMYGEVTSPQGLWDVTALSAGQWSSLALKADGSLVAWGWNLHGQSSIPAGLSNVTAISSGYAHHLALKSDQTVAAWGFNNGGQTNVPVGLSNVKAVAAGRYHGLALKADGTVVGWGTNRYDQVSIPAGLADVVAIAAGGDHSLALKADGTVIGWGEDNQGQSTVPAGLSNVTAVAAGRYHSLALKSDGTVVGWGGNNFGQTNAPAGLSNVVAIAAGWYHNLARTSDGDIVTWGGDGNQLLPVPAGVSSVSAMAAGLAHSLAVKTATE